MSDNMRIADIYASVVQDKVDELTEAAKLPDASDPTYDAQKLALDESIAKEKIKIAEQLFSGTSQVNGIGKDSSGTPIKIAYTYDSKGNPVYKDLKEVRELEEKELLKDPTLRATAPATGLSLEGRLQLSEIMINTHAASFEDRLFKAEAKKLSTAEIAYLTAQAEANRLEALDENNSERKTKLGTAESSAKSARTAFDTAGEAMKKFADKFRGEHRDYVKGQIEVANEENIKAWAVANPDVAKHIAKEQGLEKAFDANSRTSATTLRELEKEYDKLKANGIFQDKWENYILPSKNRLKGDKLDENSHDGLSEQGRDEIAKNIAKEIYSKKSRFFKDKNITDKNLNLKFDLFTASHDAIQATEKAAQPNATADDRANKSAAMRKENEVRSKYTTFVNSIPKEYKEEVQLELDGRAGELGKDKIAKLKGRPNLGLNNDEDINKIVEAAKGLKSHRKEEQAKAKGEVAAPDGKGSGKGWMMAAAAAGAAIAGTAALTGEDEVKTNDKGETETKSKWTFGRVVATVLGVITLGLAVEGLVKGDKSVIGKWTARNASEGAKTVQGFMK